MAIQIDKVLIDELVSLKILKHAKQSKPNDEKDTIGQLHGFFQNGILEVTHTYPLADQSRIAITLAEYDQQMSQRGQDVNLDNNKVGWYHISYKSDNFVAFNSFEQQISYQTACPYSVYLVYDVLEALRGVVNPFKAYRVADKYAEMSEQSKVANSELVSISTKSEKIFIPITVELHRNPLAAVKNLNKTAKKHLQENTPNKYQKNMNSNSTLAQIFQASSKKMRKISSLRKLKNEMVIFDNDSQYLYESVEQLHETNQQMNQDLMMRKSKDIKLEKDTDPLKWIENLLLLERVHTLTNNIEDESKFVQECTKVLKHLS